MTIDPKQWQAFRRGTLATDEQRATLFSVLTHPRFSDVLGGTTKEAARPTSAPAAPRLEDYGAAFDRAVAAARTQVARERRDQASIEKRVETLAARIAPDGAHAHTAAPEAVGLASVTAEPVEKVAAELADEPRALLRRVASRMRQRSLRVGFRDAEASLALARFAVAILTMPDAGAEEASPTDDRAQDEHRWAQAEAWAQLGNALRIGSDLRAADRALSNALEALDREIDPPDVQARILSLAASLRSDQSRFDEALQLCRRAARLAKRAGDPRLYHRIALKTASQYAYRGQLQPAITLLEDVRNQVDPKRDPRLALVIAHNLASYLNEDGQPEAAWQRLTEVRPQAEAIGNDLDLLRLRWLEARVQLARGHDAAGVPELEAVRDAFAAREIGYEAAQVSLELAAHHAALGAHAEVQRLARELVPMFAARDVHREARAALEVFVQAARNETAEHGLILRLTAYLERARDRPDLPFRAATS